MTRTVTVPLPGAAHPAFTPEYVSRVLSAEVGPDRIVKVLDERTGLITAFHPMGVSLVYQYVVWSDLQGRGIAQVEGTFPNLGEQDLLAHPVFADRHIELEVQ